MFSIFQQTLGVSTGYHEDYFYYIIISAAAVHMICQMLEKSECKFKLRISKNKHTKKTEKCHQEQGCLGGFETDTKCSAAVGVQAAPRRHHSLKRRLTFKSAAKQSPLLREERVGQSGSAQTVRHSGGGLCGLWL